VICSAGRCRPVLHCIALLAAQRSGGRRVVSDDRDGCSRTISSAHRCRRRYRTGRGATLLTGGAARYRVYTTADGKQLAVGALELKFWQAFCDAAGLGELKDRHWSNGEVPGSAATLETITRVTARIAQRTCAEWERRFESIDACVTPVLTPAAALAHPHHAARGLVHKQGGVTEIGPLAQINGVKWQARPALRAGEHTREMLTGLGYADAEIEQLLVSGVVKAGEC
jgi:crotonobetainyl-CoA:carnitine CoA-transferase CaiB-like acyl-CoA transferase